MDARRLLAAFVVGCATTACALDVAPEDGDSTAPASATAPPVNTGAMPDPHPGTPCMGMLSLDDAGALTVTGYLCPQPSPRTPDPASTTLPSKPPDALGQSLTTPR